MTLLATTVSSCVRLRATEECRSSRRDWLLQGVWDFASAAGEHLGVSGRQCSNCFAVNYVSRIFGLSSRFTGWHRQNFDGLVVSTRLKANVFTFCSWPESSWLSSRRDSSFSSAAVEHFFCGFSGGITRLQLLKVLQHFFYLLLGWHKFGSLTVKLRSLWIWKSSISCTAARVELCWQIRRGKHTLWA